MPTKYCKTRQEKTEVMEEVLNTPGGVTIGWQKGKKKWKSHEQDKLENLWHREAAEWLKDEEPEAKRGYCKLHFGVPILRGESDEFRSDYDKMIRPLPYEWKLQMMMAPIDFPVTRKMKTGQKARYLNGVEQHYRGLGVPLTDPDEDKELLNYHGW